MGMHFLRTGVAAQYRVVAVAHSGAAALPGWDLGRVERAAGAPRAMHLQWPWTDGVHFWLRGTLQYSRMMGSKGP
jgi:hypothetical protein